MPTYDLVRKSNAVFVSFNYRLNVFGFLALETLTYTSGLNASGNYGFMDQILALQWVKQNIQAFGGNPNDVSTYNSMCWFAQLLRVVYIKWLQLKLCYLLKLY